MIRHLVATLAILLVSLPLSAAITLTLMPVWRWLEERHRIESVGHSGPAEWCFLAVFLACVIVSGTLYALSARIRPSHEA